MKAAILFSGQLRGFNHCIDDFHKYFFSAFTEYDTFFYLPDQDGKRLFDLITPTSVILERDQTHKDIPNFQNNIGVSHTRSIENNYKPLKHMQHYYLQWYGVKRVFELFDSYRSLNNIEYDLVIRIRPDIKFYKQFEYEFFDGIQTSNKPNWGGYYDRLAYGSYNHMKHYCSLYDHVCAGKYNNFKYTGNSESKLREHIESANINWKTQDLGFYHSVNIDGTLFD